MVLIARILLSSFQSWLELPCCGEDRLGVQVGHVSVGWDLKLEMLAGTLPGLRASLGQTLKL